LNISKRIEKLEADLGGVHDTASARKVREYLATKSDAELRAILAVGSPGGEGPIADRLREIDEAQFRALCKGRI